MGFASVVEIAEAWGVSERSVRNYCAQGRVPGAVLIGKTWSVPDDAMKPARVNAKVPAISPLLVRLRDEQDAKAKGGIYHKTQIELAYNSNRIEGSRLSLDQTRLIFETATVGAEEGFLRVNDIVETVNHFRAFDYLIERASAPLNEGMLKDLHRILKTGTADASKDWFNVGDYKQLPNEVAGSRTSLPEHVHADMKALFKAYQPKRPHDFGDIVGFHVAFERIHPFQDGNGRVGRLVMFKECLANSVVPFVIEDDMKAFYYRGLSEWDAENGFLLDTCLAAQDRFKATLDYFRIPY